MHAKPPLPTFQVLEFAIEAIRILAPVVARSRPRPCAPYAMYRVDSRSHAGAAVRNSANASRVCRRITIHFVASCRSDARDEGRRMSGDFTRDLRMRSRA